VRIEPLVPAGAIAAGSSPELGIRIEAPAPLEAGAVWIDGAPLRTLAAGPDELRAVVAGPTAALAAGPHVGVGFAKAGDEATALAWTFTAG
jgi:hypothetical protein